MRLTKGCKVEVLCKKDMSVGAWRCAEIITDGGDTLKVRCEPTPGMSNGKILERVPKKNIRPSPPCLETALNWSPGDVLEVLDDGSWKSATVLKVMGGHYFLIRILGSFEEFKAHVSKTRLRQIWKDGKWIVLGNASQSSEFDKSSSKDFICYDVAESEKMIKESNRLQDSYIVSAKSLKRASPFSSSYFQAYPRKVRAVEGLKEDRPSSLINVVDTESSSSCRFGRSTGMSEYGDSDDIDANSVADSCSVNSNRMNDLAGNVLAGDSQAADADSSDAESCCGFREEQKDFFPNPEEDRSRVHQLELVAYRSTIAVIHASGPLTWAHEELLTNLRITLHISQDEHLTEVRNLISSGNPSSLLTYNRNDMNDRVMPVYV